MNILIFSLILSIYLYLRYKLNPFFLLAIAYFVYILFIPEKLEKYETSLKEEKVIYVDDSLSVKKIGLLKKILKEADFISRKTGFKIKKVKYPYQIDFDKCFCFLTDGCLDIFKYYNEYYNKIFVFLPSREVNDNGIVDVNLKDGILSVNLKKRGNVTINLKGKDLKKKLNFNEKVIEIPLDYLKVSTVEVSISLNQTDEIEENNYFKKVYSLKENPKIYFFGVAKPDFAAVYRSLDYDFKFSTLKDKDLNNISKKDILVLFDPSYEQLKKFRSKVFWNFVFSTNKNLYKQIGFNTFSVGNGVIKYEKFADFSDMIPINYLQVDASSEAKIGNDYPLFFTKDNITFFPIENFFASLITNINFKTLLNWILLSKLPIFNYSLNIDWKNLVMKFKFNYLPEAVYYIFDRKKIKLEVADDKEFLLPFIDDGTLEVNFSNNIMKKKVQIINQYIELAKLKAVVKNYYSRSKILKLIDNDKTYIYLLSKKFTKLDYFILIALMVAGWIYRKLRYEV